MIASFSSGMPPTSVYLVLPSLIALIAASLTLSGVSKSGSPAPRPMTLRPPAFSARALSVTAIVADGLTRASAADRKGIIGSFGQASWITGHDSICGNGCTLFLTPLHRKKLRQIHA